MVNAALRGPFGNIKRQIYSPHIQDNEIMYNSNVLQEFETSHLLKGKEDDVLLVYSINWMDLPSKVKDWNKIPRIEWWNIWATNLCFFT